MAAKIKRLPFFLGTLLDPEVPLVLKLPEWVAPNPLTKPALKPKFDWVVVYELGEMPEFYEGVELAIARAQQGEQAGYPELNKVSELTNA
jgi:hypothetical protein